MAVRRIAITNRHLCAGDFLQRIRRLAAGNEYEAIVLREKDLPEAEYRELAAEVLKICKAAGKPCYLHLFAGVALEFNAPLHMPLPLLETLDAETRQKLPKYGSSVHSLEQLEAAQKLGVSYVFAGHIFQTDCKKDLAPRGLEFLREIVAAAKVPVYAIGGINSENETSAVVAGAEGVCIMSGCMR